MNASAPEQPDLLAALAASLDQAREARRRAPDRFAEFRGTVISQDEWVLAPQMFCTDCGWDSGDAPTKYLGERADHHLNETDGAHHLYWFQTVIRRFVDAGPEAHDDESDAASWRPSTEEK